MTVSVPFQHPNSGPSAYFYRKPCYPDHLFSRRSCGEKQCKLELVREGLASISCLCRSWPGDDSAKPGGTAHLHSNVAPIHRFANLSAAYGAPGGAMSEQDEGACSSPRWMTLRTPA